MHSPIEDREAQTNKLLDHSGPPSEEGGKHSWFRRTDRDSLRLMGDFSINSVKSSFLHGMGLDSDDQSYHQLGMNSNNNERSAVFSNTHDRYGVPHMSSAMRATRAKIDHFGLLLEKEVLA